MVLNLSLWVLEPQHADIRLVFRLWVYFLKNEIQHP